MLAPGCALVGGAGGPATPVVAQEQGSPPPLRIGTSGDYPPFSLRGADGSFTGFDVDVARAYARSRGRELSFVPFRWPELRERLLAGDFDVAMSGVTVRPERLVAGYLTMPVAETSAVLVARRGASARDLDRPGRTFGVNRGGHLERVARAHFRRAAIRAIDDNRTLPELLETGAVDAIVADRLEVSSLVPVGGGEHGRFAVAVVLSRDRKAYWVAPSAEPLGRDLDAFLAASEADGTLPALRAQDLGEARDAGPTLSPASARVIELVARRLSLMPAVAAAKSAAGLPIEDLAREAQVEQAAAARARKAGLAPDDDLALVRAEIAAAKAIQRASGVAGTDSDSSAPPLTLDHELRPAIDRLDAAILVALVDAAPVSDSPESLLEALREATEIPGLDDDLRRAIVDGVRRAASHRPERSAASPHPRLSSSLAPCRSENA
ncbi:MAG TPA: transporter substrate-binding domain-containing protein [Candidatus Bathyarchaeia archaeon]|nr:transporter substrate-binding domain-containing protein [Candidatus Bathyarchaeia archaeon]